MKQIITMNIFYLKIGLATCLAAMMSLSGFAQNPNQAPNPGQNPFPGGFPGPRQVAQKIQTPTFLADYFTEATTDVMSPDKNGFIQRWLLLEPIDKPNRSNTVFTDSYLRQAFDTLYFKNQFTVLPKDGDKVKVDKQNLVWHALDSKLYNVKLYRFAAALKKQVYGVLFWAVTIVDCPEDIENVRMSVGSNGGSLWWLNSEEAVILSGDRRMVVDDCLSRRLTLKKGKNIIRGAVINGPGMSDFCVRFLNENGEPVKNITISYK
ncbi:hypothetical protein FACS189437_04990 [Bacteroidia bacterium]|nr:hypothetical protein FACS189437_04990 [Bacteroidia bacterium]